MLGRYRGQSCEVGRLGGRRRNGEAWGGFGERAHEALETGRLGDEQKASLGRRDGEGLGNAARAVDERSLRGVDQPTAHPEAELPLGDVEPLVLVVVHMERRAGALRGEVLDHGDTPVGCLARSLDRGEDAEEPERLTLVFVQCERAEGGAGGGAHRELLPVFRETSCFTMQQTYCLA